MSTVKDIKDLLSPQEDAAFIDSLMTMFEQMQSGRSKWEQERDEILTYLYATDTQDTVGVHTEFDNSTTINKLAQIYNNIKVGYMEYLFPNEDWVQWEGHQQEDNTLDKKTTISSYVRTKIRTSGAMAVLERMVDDWTQCGMCACMTRYITRNAVGVEYGTTVPSYVGPDLVRIDPLNFYYDTAADNLDDATKCVVSSYSLGDLKKMVGDSPDSLITQEQFKQIISKRQAIKSAVADKGKSATYLINQLQRAGYGDTLDLMTSDRVEILTFFGTFYDVDNDVLYEDHRIVVADRHMILNKTPPNEWRPKQGLHVAVWEYREGTLAPIGPLNRIVGLQYKIDKLENLRADIFDRIAHPERIEVGDVQHFGAYGAPDAKYVVEEGGSVQYLHPPTQALAADMQIANTMQLMEDLAGAPKEAIGQRTPGEKTKFEVQLLDQGQNKLFRSKVKLFESSVLTRILEDYLALGRLYLDGVDSVTHTNKEFNYDAFLAVTKDDLRARGRVLAAGASIFAERANALQTLVTLSGTPLWALIQRHVSRKLLTTTAFELGGLDKYKMVTMNIGVQEDIETQQLAQQSQAEATEGDMTGAHIAEDEGLEGGFPNE